MGESHPYVPLRVVSVSYDGAEDQCNFVKKNYKEIGLDEKHLKEYPLLKNIYKDNLHNGQLLLSLIQSSMQSL